MHPIVANEQLSPNVYRLVVEAPRIAQIRQPGQFVMVRIGPGGERIPLTIADADPAGGTITLIIQSVGKTTADLTELAPGDAIRDVAGPLGRPTELLEGGHAVCVGGGVGTAVILPIAQELGRRGVRVTSVIGGRSREWVILEPELARCGRVVTCTDDGSYGRPGFVTDALRDELDAGGVDAVYAVGPVPMMRAVSELTRPYGVPTTVSLNAIMVDGTGMCGGCRVVIDGQSRYACVDGPEFDGHLVDFRGLADRLTTYRSFEQAALERREACKIGGRTGDGEQPVAAGQTSPPVETGQTPPPAEATAPVETAR
jgi:ferredoxin--NADP+ reductase